MVNMVNDYIYLANERLNAEIALPGTYYKGGRFDWNGFVTQVTLDGAHTFCAPESLIEGHGSGGRGLCGEFGIYEPVGYDEAPVGGCFPKIGVGNIMKCDESGYDFFKKYDFSPYGATIEKSENSIGFHMPVNCNGYSLLYEKKITLEGCRLKAGYFLKNIGKKAVSTTEYCHNFIRIDGERVGRGYVLSLPHMPSVDGLPPETELCGHNAVAWKDEGWEGAFYCVIGRFKPGDGCSWDICNWIKGAGVREYDDFEPVRFALWGMRHVISPEAFVGISLKPGEELKWTRSYEFYIL